ncbi:MAG TPA: hypothetical protein VH143_20925 [Kofleriaceae bacterium]|jgi:hypothetical protein|nr:hypothetical protein [Kofleriaceae bacterium]
MTAVDDLVRGRTQQDGRDVEFILSIPSFAELASYLRGVPRDREQEQTRARQRLFDEVAQFDGAGMSLDKARSLLAYPHLLGDIFSARNRFHDAARQQGRLYALCPGCKTAEAELSFMDLLLRLRMSPPPLTTPDGIWLPPPGLSERYKLVLGMRRGDLPVAQQIRFELPSARMGFGAAKRPTGGIMAKLDPASDEASLEHYWPDGSHTSGERPWWYREGPLFRALVRITTAVARFDRGPKPSPVGLEALPAIDVEYLDMAVIAMQLTDEPPEDKLAPGLVQRPRNLPVTCPTCQTRYLPLM